MVRILFGYLDDKSKIVRTFSMDALASFALKNGKLKPKVVRTITEMVESGSPAIQSRGRRLLKKLQ